MPANDKQVGGDHYGLRTKQHWDLVDEFNWDYFQAQIIKYVMRWEEKGGLEDLQKAQHFLEKYIELNDPEMTGKHIELNEPEIAENEDATQYDGDEDNPEGYVDQDR